VSDHWQTIDPVVRLDPNDYIDWGAVDRITQRRYGELATFWVQKTPGVNYYRAELPARHLPGRSVEFNESDITPELEFRRQVGAAVWLFPGNDVRALMMAEMHLQGIPVFVEVDDNYTTPPPIKQLSRWSANRAEAMRTGLHDFETHVLIVGSPMVDGVICATPKLAELYSRLHRNVHVCPNSIDPDDWPEAEPPHAPDGVLRIGWAGSASHGYDLNDIYRALSWAAGQPDVEVVLFGELGLPIEHRNIPWARSLADYRQNVVEIDVMLCPLRPSAWSDCKSDSKALEAAMGGACPVVARAEPFRPWWAAQRPCYVAETPKDFLKIVKHLVANRDEARQTARLAREYVLAERTIQVSIQRWRDALSTQREEVD